MSSRPKQIALLLTAVLAAAGLAFHQPDAFLVAALIAAGGLIFPPRHRAAWLLAIPLVGWGLWMSSLDSLGCSAWWRGRIVAEKMAGRLPYVDWGQVRRTVFSSRGVFAACQTHAPQAAVAAGRVPASFDRLGEKIMAGHQCELYRTGLGDFWTPSPGGNSLLSFLIWEMTVQEDYTDGDVAVRAGDTVIDCGAHVGVFTRYALRRGAARVIAIEPDPVNHACLRENLAHEVSAGRVILVNAGVWDQVSKLSLKTPIGGNSGMPTLIGVAPGDPGATEVPVMPLDQIIAESGVDRVDFIKMDIEGSERHALNGAVKTIARFKPRMAICSYHLEDDPVRLPEIVKRAYSGYRIHAKDFEITLGRMQPKVLLFQ